MDSGVEKRMQEIKEVAIIGVGLLGSSLGLALRNLTPVKKVIGYDNHEEHIKTALEIGSIDQGISSLDLDSFDGNQGFKEVDLVFLATPVGVIPELIEKIQPQLKSGAIITDVGSTKRQLVKEIDSVLRDDLVYIPGHPMTGSEISGPEGADLYLFENAVYVLTPSEDIEEEKIELLRDLLQIIGAKLLFMSPKQHDQIVAAVSHLPHIMACTLVDTVGEVAKEEERVFSLAAGGFRDTTRIASGSSKMWTDICLHNKEAIQIMIKVFKERLTEFEDLLTATNTNELLKKFDHIRNLRRQIPKKKRGLISPNYEIILTLPDRPKAIGEATSLLGEAGINIVDIEILRVREQGGTLRLVVATEEELKTAENLLIKAGYKLQIK
ncbi:prephenate dehydrogenase [Candidatus Frackibacter sp. WG13]|nr:prephenate dehydrogenase [Candidatus Frackibacter sp. WG13]